MATTEHQFASNSVLNGEMKPKLKLRLKKTFSFKTSSESKSVCKHPWAVHRRCCCCNQFVPPNHGVSFDYITKGLRLSREQILRLKSVQSENVFGQKKLHLVLDLDHTLLHAKDIKKMTDEEWLLLDSKILSSGDLFVCNNEYLVKLRPFVMSFLEQASEMFELYVCSMGSRRYVQSVVGYLDPEGKYFGNRVIARQDFGQRHEKTLDLVLGLDRGTVIVDDTQSVWRRFLGNLIWVQRYVYFKTHSEDECYIGKEKDESELGGCLVQVLADLRRLHSWFFSDKDDINVRHVRDCHLDDIVLGL